MENTCTTENTLQKLQIQLEQVESKLEVIRSKVAELKMSAPRSQRRWKAERNWDVYAQRRMELIGQIDELQAQ